METKTQTTMLPVMEMFYSVQGEGANTGTPSFFIRLAGCDVGCHWCDVKESWDEAVHPRKRIEDIVSEVVSTGAKSVVVTGGEPLMHNLEGVCQLLHEAGIRILLETSGAYPLNGSFDWICVSPKKFKAPLPEVLAAAHELKVVVFHKSDIDWALENARYVSASCLRYLQPEWDKSDAVLPLIIDYVKIHPDWKISLQTHKWMGVR